MWYCEHTKHDLKKRSKFEIMKSMSLDMLMQHVLYDQCFSVVKAKHANEPDYAINVNLKSFMVWNSTINKVPSVQ